MQTLDLAWRDTWAQRIDALQTGAGEHALADLSADNLFLFRHAHDRVLESCVEDVKSSRVAFRFIHVRLTITPGGDTSPR